MGISRLIQVFWVFSSLAAFLSAGARAEEPDPYYASKVSLRMTNGILLNEGTVGGGSPIVGGLNLSYLAFPLDRWGIGGGYRVDFDYNQMTIPLHGYFVFSRIYVWGRGTLTKEVSERLSSKTLDLLGFYAGGLVGYSNYYFGPSPVDTGNTDILEGTYIGLDALVGMDYRLSKKFEVNMEGQFGYRTFSQSDSRFRIRGMLFTMGLSYLW